MSMFTSQSATFNGRVSHFATPTRRRSPFTPSDGELAAITGGCAERNATFVHHRRSSSNRRPRVGKDCVNAATCTPVQARQLGAPTFARQDRTEASPTCAAAATAAVSPRRRRCTGPALADVDAPCGSPRVRLAMAPSGRRQGTERPLLCERSCSSALHDSFAEVLATKAVSPPSCLTRSARTRTTTTTTAATTPSLASTPTEPHTRPTFQRSADDVSGCPFARTASESLAVDEGSTASRSLRPPSSPSFSFFSTVAEKRNSRAAAAGSSARSDFQQQHQQQSQGHYPHMQHVPVVSPRSFAFRIGQSPFNDPAAASLSSSALATEVKVFSPLRFDARAVPSVQSQGLSSMAQSHHSSVPLLHPHGSITQWHFEEAAAEEEEDRDAVVLADAPAGSPPEVRDVVRQQRLLHACLVSVAREKAELAMEVHRLRQRRCVAVLRLALHVLLRLPFRVVAQLFRIVANAVNVVAAPPLSPKREIVLTH